MCSALALLACEPDPPVQHLAWCCDAPDATALIDCITECSNSASTDEGNDIVYACQSVCMGALCVKPKEVTYTQGPNDVIALDETACLRLGMVPR